MMYDDSVKSKPQYHFVKLKNESPIFIVGQNPGHTKEGLHTGTVWEKSPSADLLWEAIGKRKNLFITNICNYTIMNEKRIEEGIKDLVIDIEVMRPKKILCLGSVSYKHVKDIIENKRMVDRNDIKVMRVFHPSFILRFDKSREEWINQVRGALDE